MIYSQVSLSQPRHLNFCRWHFHLAFLRHTVITALTTIL